MRGYPVFRVPTDKNTKFFHASATTKNNKNSIMALYNDNEEKFKHEKKAELLWQAYKERLGTSEFTQIHFSLNEFIQEVHRLEDLIRPFSTDEIDNIDHNLPLGKSPGPDDFNTDFIKKCWGIMSQDFYDMCLDFHGNNLCLGSINGSYIILVPKVDNPRKVSDFRPISFLNSTIKLIAKILAN
jgi:hypothetical protein